MSPDQVAQPGQALPLLLHLPEPAALQLLQVPVRVLEAQVDLEIQVQRRSQPLPVNPRPKDRSAVPETIHSGLPAAAAILS